jgi:hypothetical protein
VPAKLRVDARFDVIAVIVDEKGAVVTAATNAGLAVICSGTSKAAGVEVVDCVAGRSAKRDMRGTPPRSASLRTMK